MSRWRRGLCKNDKIQSPSRGGNVCWKWVDIPIFEFELPWHYKSHVTFWNFQPPKPLCINLSYSILNLKTIRIYVLTCKCNEIEYKVWYFMEIISTSSRSWCSGIIVPSHGTDRGSIPRLRTAFSLRSQRSFFHVD